MGEPNVKRLLRRFTAKQFRDWEIYNELEPFGEIRADYRAASISSMIFNMAVEPKHRKPLKEFLLKFEQTGEKPKQTWQQQLQLLKILSAAYSTNVPVAKD